MRGRVQLVGERRKIDAIIGGAWSGRPISKGLAVRRRQLPNLLRTKCGEKAMEGDDSAAFDGFEAILVDRLTCMQ